MEEFLQKMLEEQERQHTEQMEVLKAIDWKLWEIMKVAKQFSDEDDI